MSSSATAPNAQARPKRFDRDIVVLGAGSGGLVTAYIGALARAKVTLIEKDRMGGDCLNTGCVPSKALIRSAKLLHEIRHSADYGVARATGEIDFAETMERVQRVIAKIAPHDSVERYRGLGVDVVEGEGRLTSPWTVEANGRSYTTRRIVVATGGSPFVPPIPGLDEAPYLTNENLWQLRTLPRRFVVLGGGPIGSELAQTFRRLGSEVWQVELEDSIMGREDPEIREMVTRRFEQEGIHVMTGTKAVAVERDGEERVLVCERGEERLRLPFDALLVAVGRRANTKGFGLEALGVALDEDGTIRVDPYLRTSVPSIAAVGDVAGPYQFTHFAAHQAWFAAINALADPFWKFRADYSVIPWATFTDPEIARVGLNESEAKARGIAHEVTVYGIDDLDRAIADSADHGVVKILTAPGKDRILGVTIAGKHAGDLIAEYVLAMKQGIGLNKILGTIHIYPTLAEANKYAAGEWKRARQPERLLGWIERFHAWRRGERGDDRGGDRGGDADGASSPNL